MENVKIFVDFNKVDLDKYLTQSNRKILEQYNLLYILKSKSENNIFKIGKSYGVKRLAEYIFYLGNVEKNNKCSGVELYYLAGVKKTLYTNPNNSIIFRKETQLKNDLKEYLIRGTERFRTTQRQIQKILNKKGFMTEEEIQDNIVRTITKDDKVISIIGHIEQKNGKVRKFYLKWNRPYNNDDGITLESIQVIKKLPSSTNAMLKLRQYIKKKKLKVNL